MITLLSSDLTTIKGAHYVVDMERFRRIDSIGHDHQWNSGQYFSEFDFWSALLFVKPLDYQSGSFALCIGELDD
jgi:hypothetical protein